MCDEGFPGGTGGKEPTYQCRRYKRRGFDSLVRKLPRRRAWQPTPDILVWRIPWTEELGGLQSMGCQESDITELLHFGALRILNLLSESLDLKAMVVSTVIYAISRIMPNRNYDFTL